MGNYLNKTPKGDHLPNEKSTYLASLADEELKELPAFDLIPVGLILVACVENTGFEAAMVVDNAHDWQRVYNSMRRPEPRPCRFFLIKREWVEQMADKPLRDP